MPRRKFTTFWDALEGLSQPSTHVDAATALLAHADVFDTEASWAYARPTMRTIIAYFRDRLDAPAAVSGLQLPTAICQLITYYERQTGTTVRWDADIDPEQAFAARASFDSGDDSVFHEALERVRRGAGGNITAINSAVTRLLIDDLAAMLDSATDPERN